MKRPSQPTLVRLIKSAPQPPLEAEVDARVNPGAQPKANAAMNSGTDSGVNPRMRSKTHSEAHSKAHSETLSVNYSKTHSGTNSVADSITDSVTDSVTDLSELRLTKSQLLHHLHQLPAQKQVELFTAWVAALETPHLHKVSELIRLENDLRQEFGGARSPRDTALTEVFLKSVAHRRRNSSEMTP
ncbi:MAG: hypothetical protein MUF49_17600, partial [Oculatellaceae cyanobacterium Prado106]|nr:hypothetical protein [Oculatellaceae cyanobacterium Prado106]